MHIPKIAHFIWSNKNGLPFSRMLSITTFAHLNPDFKIFYHTFENDSSSSSGLRGGESVCQTDHSDFISSLNVYSNIEIINHTDLHGTDVSHPPTFLSDLLRYKLLGDIGGYYFDTDILFYIPMSESYLFSGLYTDITCIISHSKAFGSTGAHRIGVLGSKPNSRVFRNAYDVARWSIDPSEYQSAGSESLQHVLGGSSLYRKFDASYPDEVLHNLLDSFAYRYSFESMSENLPLNILNWVMQSINPWFASVHWYGGVLSDSIDRDQSILPPVDGKQRFVDFLFTQAIELVKNKLDN